MLWAPVMLGSSLLTAKGAVAEQLRIQLINAPLLVGAILLGSQFDLVTLAVLANLTVPVRLVLLSRALRERCGVGFGETLIRLKASMLVGAAGIACGFLARWCLNWLGAHAFVVLALGGTSVLGGALAAAAALKHPLYVEALRLKQKVFARF